MTTRALPILFALVLGLAACGGDVVGPPKPKAAASVPDAMCKQHGVLGAVCTRCNPKLAPIFQEKGDWCAEHALPESFCPTCHPEKGGRPAADIADDGAPANGTRVVLRTAEAVQAAAIEVVEARTPQTVATVSVLASIAYDARQRAEVNPRLPGIVRDVLVDVGTRVTKGTPLFRIESAALGAELSRFTAANSRLRVAEHGRDRVKGLFDSGMAARKELLEAELEVDAARAEISSVTAALGLIDVEPGSASTYALLAPIDGMVVRLQALAGRMVDAAERLCEIVDTSLMWAELDVPELELGQVTAGLSVHVSIESLGERELEGKIDYIAPQVDPRTRTVKARVRLDNSAGLLRAGMYATAIVTLGPSRARVMVPIDALQRAGKFHLVFVRVADNTYETRRVKLGARCAHDVEIMQGIEPGERVAARGSFLLKTETLRGSIGAGCCEVD